MKVIVVEKIEYYAYDDTFSTTVGTTTITMTDKLYHLFPTILGVYVSADAARAVIEEEKMEIIKRCGEKALDDENISDMHTYYTFATYVLELRGTVVKEGDKNGG